MDVKFVTVRKSNLNAVPVVDGQVIAVEDANGFYYDQNSQRYPVSCVRVLPKLEGMGRYEEMIQAIDWMQSHRPDVLSKMFDSGRDELDPQYITESGGTSNPYVNIPYETRHMRAVQYVTGMARRAGWDG